MKKSIYLASTFIVGFLFAVAPRVGADDLSGDYSAYLEGNDWGENISRVTLHLKQKVDTDPVSKDDFTLSEK